MELAFACQKQPSIHVIWKFVRRLSYSSRTHLGWEVRCDRGDTPITAMSKLSPETTPMGVQFNFLLTSLQIFNDIFHYYKKFVSQSGLREYKVLSIVHYVPTGQMVQKAEHEWIGAVWKPELGQLGLGLVRNSCKAFRRGDWLMRSYLIHIYWDMIMF